MTDKKPVAWMVSNYNDEGQAVIVFHHHGLAARRIGAPEVGCDDDSDATIERKKEYDTYADKGCVPIRVLINDGWWFECSGPKCYRIIYQDENYSVRRQEAFCENCSPEIEMQIDAEWLREKNNAEPDCEIEAGILSNSATRTVN